MQHTVNFLHKTISVDLHEAGPDVVIEPVSSNALHCPLHLMPQSSPCAQHDQSSPELHASARYVVYVQETVRKHAQCMQNARDRRHGATEKKARQKPELQVNRSLSIQEKHTAGNS